MPYYQTGDYSTGGYYGQGDPGLRRFFRSVGKVIKRVAPIAAGFIPGVGPLLRVGLGALAAGAGAAAGVGQAIQYGQAGLSRVPKTPMGYRLPQIPAALGAFGQMTGPPAYAAAGCPPGTAVACPPGCHPAKDGSGRCVRNRRMNPLNPRALRRAMRREEGFKRLASKMGYVRRKR